MNRIGFACSVMLLGLGLALSSSPTRAQDTATKPAVKKTAKKQSAPQKSPVKVPGKAESTVIPVPREGDWWTGRHEKMNARVAQGNVDLLMIGDSITQGWEGSGAKVWQEYYGTRNAVNLGIGGDRTQHVLWRLTNGNLKGISPKLAVLMIGTNNAGANSPEEIAAGIEAIVKTLRKEVPQTKILVLAIFPRGADQQNAARQINQKANAIVSKLADGDTVRYLDIGKNFLQPDDTLTKEIMPDLLHLSPKGYEIWAKAIEPEVAKALGPRK